MRAGCPFLTRSGYANPIYCTAATRDLSRGDARRLGAHPGEGRRVPGAAPARGRAAALRDARRHHRRGPDGRIAVRHAGSTSCPGMRAIFTDAGHILGSASVTLECMESGTPQAHRVLGRHRPARAPDHPRPAATDRWRRRRAPRVHLRQPRPSAGGRRARSAGAAWSARQRRAAAACSSRRSPWAARRSSSTTCTSWREKGRSPRSRSTSTARWRSTRRRCSRCIPRSSTRRRISFRRCRTCSSSRWCATRATRPSRRRSTRSTGRWSIIAASGMAEAGRILHHLAHGASDPRNTILIVGFQAEHTLGRRIVERAPMLRVFGDEIPLRARVEVLAGYSAHGDRHELQHWLDAVRDGGTAAGGGTAPDVYLVHGEPDAQDAFAAQLVRRDTRRWTPPCQHRKIVAVTERAAATPPRRTRGRASSTRGVRCIAREGVAGASMAAIALEAGVSKALLHYHYHDRATLLAEIVERIGAADDRAGTRRHRRERRHGWARRPVAVARGRASPRRARRAGRAGTRPRGAGAPRDPRHGEPIARRSAARTIERLFARARISRRGCPRR